MPPKAATKSKPRSSAVSKPSKPPPIPKAPNPKTRTLSKSLVLDIILTKLEYSKGCDWYELSQRLAGGKAGRVSSKAKRGKKELSGSDLHDLYHNFVLPSLKSGRALWAEGVNEVDVDCEESCDLDDDYEEEEGNASGLVEKRTTRVRGRTLENRTVSQLLGSDVDAIDDQSEEEAGETEEEIHHSSSQEDELAPGSDGESEAEEELVMPPAEKQPGKPSYLSKPKPVVSSPAQSPPREPIAEAKTKATAKRAVEPKPRPATKRKLPSSDDDPLDDLGVPRTIQPEPKRRNKNSTETKAHFRDSRNTRSRSSQRITVASANRPARPLVPTVQAQTRPTLHRDDGAVQLHARAQGRAEGRAEGRAQGRAEGRAQGRAHGRAQGRAQGRA